MEAGDSRSGGMPQVWCAASASQNVPGMRYLQWPSGQGDQVRGRWQVSHRRVSLLGGKRFSSLLTFCPFSGLVVCRAGRCPHRPVRKCIGLLFPLRRGGVSTPPLRSPMALLYNEREGQSPSPTKSYHVHPRTLKIFIPPGYSGSHPPHRIAECSTGRLACSG